jgi:hypothetical protein
MMKISLQRGIALFLTSLLFLVSLSCGAVSTAVSTPSEVATMNSYPISAVPLVSVPLTGEWRFSIDKDQAGEQGGWAESNFDDSSWVAVQFI